MLRFTNSLSGFLGINTDGLNLAKIVPHVWKEFLEMNVILSKSNLSFLYILYKPRFIASQHLCARLPVPLVANGFSADFYPSECRMKCQRRWYGMNFRKIKCAKLKFGQGIQVQYKTCHSSAKSCIEWNSAVPDHSGFYCC